MFPSADIMWILSLESSGFQVSDLRKLWLIGTLQKTGNLSELQILCLKTEDLR